MGYPFPPGTVQHSTSEPARVQRVRDDVAVVNAIVDKALIDVRQKVQVVGEVVAAQAVEAAKARDDVTADAVATRDIVIAEAVATRDAIDVQAATARQTVATLTSEAAAARTVVAALVAEAAAARGVFKDLAARLAALDARVAAVELRLPPPVEPNPIGV